MPGHANTRPTGARRRPIPSPPATRFLVAERPVESQAAAGTIQVDLRSGAVRAWSPPINGLFHRARFHGTHPFAEQDSGYARRPRLVARGAPVRSRGWKPGTRHG